MNAWRGSGIKKVFRLNIYFYLTYTTFFILTFKLHIMGKVVLCSLKELRKKTIGRAFRNLFQTTVTFIFHIIK